MTTNLMPAALDPSSNDELTALPPGLTEADAARVTAAISAAHAESTRTLYTRDWSRRRRTARRVRLGLRRTCGGTPRRLARPLTLD